MFLMEDFEPARNLGFCWAKKKVFNRPERSVPTRESLLMQDLKQCQKELNCQQNAAF